MNRTNPMPPKALDKAFWAQVSTNKAYERLVESVKKLWDDNCGDSPILAQRYSIYSRYWRDGNRTEYEGMFFRHRYALTAAALLALIYPEEEEYLLYAQDEIFAICNEYSWALPAHQPFHDYNFNFPIDLFAAETGMMLSEIYYVLGDRLDSHIKARIITEVNRRIIDIYPTTYYPWEAARGNWSAVCNCGVAVTFMLMRPELYEFIEKRIDVGINAYLSYFSEEGFCPEGPGYWSYGYGHFIQLADMLRRFTDGKNDWFKDERARKAASFKQNLFLSGNAGVSFEDGGGMTLGYIVCIQHYLKHEYPDEINVPPFKYAGFLDTFSNSLRSFVFFDEEIVKAEKEQPQYFEKYAPGMQWYIKRTPNYGFAMKGGSNNEAHNHNDVGTFIFAKNGKQRICDFGPGEYTHDYFHGDRYSFCEPSSRSHAVPIINGIYQYEGEDTYAKEFALENGRLHVDIAPAYQAAGLLNMYRDFLFDDNGITLTDTAVFDSETAKTATVVSRLPSFEKPVISGNTVTLEDTVITFKPDECAVEINEEDGSRNRHFYFVDFKFKDVTKSITLRIE